MVYLTLQQSLRLLYFFYVVFFLRKAFLDYGPSSEKIEAFLSHVHECIDEFLRSGDPNYYEYENEDQESEKTEKTENLENSEKKESEIKKPTRFEDKYLNEYKNLGDIELNEEKLDSLKSNIIMENTPIGNVVMFYDNKKETFVFYSDLTMPYRYLEVVGRKYVVTFNCKKLFINMDEELKLAEEKKVKKQDSTSSSNEVQNITSTSNCSNKVKKDVFVKFKSYNNNVTKEVVSAPSKNTGTTTKKENSNLLLKENANRYRYEGKLVNFNFLRPVDKKQTDKRLSISWADYKNISANIKN